MARRTRWDHDVERHCKLPEYKGKLCDEDAVVEMLEKGEFAAFPKFVVATSNDPNKTHHELNPLWVGQQRPHVRRLSAMGMTDRDLADWLDMDVGSMMSHFKEVITQGRTELNLSIRKAQLAKGIKNLDTQMLIWLGKVYLQQKEKQEIDHNHNIRVEPIFFRDLPALEHDDAEITID